MPILYPQFPFRIVYFIIILIIRQIFPTGKTIKADQRIHVKTSRYRFVLYNLSHHVHITVQSQTLIEHYSCFPQVDVMLCQLVLVYNTTSGSIGIRKISLYLFISIIDGYGSNGS